MGLAGVASAGAGAQEGTTYTVDMTDELVFDPDEVTVAPGDTVVWENVGQIGHTVTAYEDEIPEEAGFFASGGFESESAARSAYPPGGDVAGGESYEHTFDVEGVNGYFCIPHEGVGMVATLSVVPGGAQPAGGGEPATPEVAKALGVGVRRFPDIVPVEPGGPTATTIQPASSARTRLTRSRRGQRSLPSAGR